MYVQIYIKVQNHGQHGYPVKALCFTWSQRFWIICFSNL